MLEPEQSDFGDEASSLKEYRLEPLSTRGFAPWHHPRKQLVREQQWCAEILSMFDNARPAGGTLKYLGLPGSDLFDIRCFHERVCEPNQIDLHFLGFNSAAGEKNSEQHHLEISIDEIKKLPRITANSDVIGDDFRSLANDDSIAWSRACQHGPYDVVNLDLCDGFAKDPPNGLDASNFDAVHKLLSLQSKHKQPWLLFLTTRVGTAHTHPEVVERFRTQYLSNLQDCKPFMHASVKNFGIGSEQELDKALTDTLGYLIVFIVGLNKWLLKNAALYVPPIALELKSLVGYHVYSTTTEDLVSLALRFTPTIEPPKDPLGLASAGTPKLDECKLAVPILYGIKHRQDADAILSSDNALKKEMIDNTIQLLQLARYDTTKYQSWLTAKDTEQKTKQDSVLPVSDAKERESKSNEDPALLENKKI